MLLILCTNSKAFYQYTDSSFKNSGIQKEPHTSDDQYSTALFEKITSRKSTIWNEENPIPTVLLTSVSFYKERNDDYHTLVSKLTEHREFSLNHHGTIGSFYMPEHVIDQRSIQNNFLLFEMLDKDVHVFLNLTNQRETNRKYHTYLAEKGEFITDLRQTLMSEFEKSDMTPKDLNALIVIGKGYKHILLKRYLSNLSERYVVRIWPDQEEDSFSLPKLFENIRQNAFSNKNETGSHDNRASFFAYLREEMKVHRDKTLLFNDVLPMAHSFDISEETVRKVMELTPVEEMEDSSASIKSHPSPVANPNEILSVPTQVNEHIERYQTDDLSIYFDVDAVYSYDADVALLGRKKHENDACIYRILPNMLRGDMKAILAFNGLHEKEKEVLENCSEIQNGPYGKYYSRDYDRKGYSLKDVAHVLFSKDGSSSDLTIDALKILEGIYDLVNNLAIASRGFELENWFVVETKRWLGTTKRKLIWSHLPSEQCSREEMNSDIHDLLNRSIGQERYAELKRDCKL